jgi:hypothetical protein
MKSKSSSVVACVLVAQTCLQSQCLAMLLEEGAYTDSKVIS